jgi:hypothetical protein
MGARHGFEQQLVQPRVTHLLEQLQAVDHLGRLPALQALLQDPAARRVRGHAGRRREPALAERRGQRRRVRLA